MKKIWPFLIFGLVMLISGIYSKIRHPQYLGFIGFTLGWLVYWPTLPTLIIWPVLLYAYISQSYKEDRFLSERFGSSFREYYERTGRFFPKIF